MKIKSQPKNMFTCLYIESLVGLVLTFFIFINVTNVLLRHEDIGSFIDNGNSYVQDYIDSQYERHGFYHKLNTTSSLLYYDYKLMLSDSAISITDVCSDCELFKRRDGIDVYIKNNQLFVAAFPIPRTNKQLFFIETQDPFSADAQWYEDSDNQFFFALFVTLSIALAGLIYLPLHRVNKRINKLLAVQTKFGQGDLSVRSEVFHISPIKELAQSFNDMADDIELRVKESLVFSHAIPHEIRTPLTRIHMASDLLRREDTKDKQTLFNDIDSYIEDISHLTSDILKLSRLTNGHCGDLPIAREAFSVSELVEKRIDVIADTKQIQFIIDSNIQDDRYLASKCLSKLVIDNLLKNALRYGGGVVNVTLREYQSCWTLDVEDNGPGIPIEKREEVFIAFSRLDSSRNHNNGGFGLGLAIVAQASRNLGWSVSVDESHIGGARFTVVLPKA